MKDALETVNILATYDLTQSLRSVGELHGCFHHTVVRLVKERDSGRAPGAGIDSVRVTDAWLTKIEEWVDRTRGRIRADVIHEKLLPMGYPGSARSTRRAVSEVKEAYRRGNKRVHRPWITEPGGWLQYDFGDGPVI